MIKTFESSQDVREAFPECVKSEEERLAWHNLGIFREVRISGTPGNAPIFILCKPTTLYEWSKTLTKWANLGVPIVAGIGRPTEYLIFLEFLEENPLRRAWWDTCNDLFPLEFEVD